MLEKITSNIAIKSDFSSRKYNLEDSLEALYKKGTRRARGEISCEPLDLLSIYCRKGGGKA